MRPPGSLARDARQGVANHAAQRVLGGKGRCPARLHRRQSMPRPPAPARAGLFSERANLVDRVVAGNGFQCQAGIKLIVPPRLGIDEWVNGRRTRFRHWRRRFHRRFAASRGYGGRLWRQTRSPDPKHRRRHYARKAQMPSSAISPIPAALGKPCSRADAIVHLAQPQTFDGRVTTARAKRYGNDRLAMDRTLFKAVDPTKTRRIIYVAGTSYYGECGHTLCDEDAVPHPRGFGPYLAPAIEALPGTSPGVCPSS